jgi:tetratricopeptide (TPR) repeat protein
MMSCSISSARLLSGSGGRRVWRLALLLVICSAQPVVAGWWEVIEAESNLDIALARERALAIVTSAPATADAVAAAGWWGSNLSHLAEPEAILAAPGADCDCDPALIHLLTRIEAELNRRAPTSVLATAELAGPFGIFDTLDLERQVVPPDHELPALGSRWTKPAEPYCLRLHFGDGWVGPPDSMITKGVYLAAWSLKAERQVTGWLAVEARGSYNLEVNRKLIARHRYCGAEAPGIVWYRIDLMPGDHRLRIEIASLDAPRIRVALLDDNGRALDGLVIGTERVDDLAQATVSESLPPAESALISRLDQGGGTVKELLLAAELARLRADPVAERTWLEKAEEQAPDDPWMKLALASFYLTQPTGGAFSTDLQRCRDTLRGSRSLPSSQLLERVLALRQDRYEDAERMIEELIEVYPDDPRVLDMWISESVQRGWIREAEESLERLRTVIPGSHSLTEKRLDLLADLEHWDERNQLLLALAETGPDTLRRADQLASSCFQDEALEIMERLADEGDSPSFEVGTVRLLLESGRIDEARAALEQARKRWGDLFQFDSLDMVAAATQPDRLDQALAQALERRPWDLDLRSMAWRLGLEPFFAKYQVDGMKVAAEQEKQVVAEETDAALLLDQAVERIFADGSSIYYYHGITRAVTPNGAKQASTLQHLPDSLILNLRIIKPDGSIVVPPELKYGTVEINLNDVEPGDLVEEEYLAAMEPTGASRRGHLSPYTYRFADSERAFGLSEYVLLVPDGIELMIDGNFTGLEREEREEEGLRVISWRAESVPPIPREPYGPPNQELLPWVSYGFGVSWQDVGDAIRDQVLPVLRSSPELRAWSEPLIAKEEPLAAVQSLVDALSEEVEVGRGHLVPGTTAGASFSLKTSNRIAIIASVLAEADWQVDLLLARPRALAGTHLEVPGTETFYQPLLRVMHDQQTIWIDIEEDRRGVDHISPILQGSDALVLPLTRPMVAVSYLELLPEMANPDLEDRQRMVVEVDAAGNATLTLEISLRGARAERMLQQFHSVPEDRLAIIYNQIATRFFPGASQIEGSIERREDGALMSFSMALPHACEVSETVMTCRGLVIGSPLSPALASLPERKFPLILQLPVQRRFKVELTAPPGFTMERPPRLLSTPWGEVAETIEVSDRVASSELYLQVPAQTVTPEQYPEFARFCLAVDELISRPPELRRSAK